MVDNEISHEDFETIINDEKKYLKLKESVRMMNIVKDLMLRKLI